MFSTKASKVYSQLQGTNVRTDVQRAETNQYWKEIWEKEATHSTYAQLPEQKLVTITVTYICE